MSNMVLSLVGSLHLVQVPWTDGSPLLLWRENDSVPVISEKDMVAVLQSMGYPVLLEPKGRAVVGFTNDVLCSIHKALTYIDLDTPDRNGWLRALAAKDLDLVQTDGLRLIFPEAKCADQS